jgi:hypothetical protein
MAKRFKIQTPIDDAFSVVRLVASGGAATIDRGTPTKQGSSGAVAIMADGEGTTSELFTGMAKNVSTDTAAASGVVTTYLPLAGVVYSGSPKTAGAANSAADIYAEQGVRTVLDLTGTDWTVDDTGSDAIGNAVVVVGGNPNEDILYFVVTHTMINFFENN